MARLSSLPGALIEASENLCDLSLRGRYRKSHRQRRDEHNGTGYHWAAHKAFIHRGGACALPELFQLGNKKPVFPPCFQAGVTHIRVTQAVACDRNTRALYQCQPGAVRCEQTQHSPCFGGAGCLLHHAGLNQTPWRFVSKPRLPIDVFIFDSRAAAIENEMRWTKRLKWERWVCLPDPAADQEAAWKVRSKHVQEMVRLCIASSWTEKAQEEIPPGIPAPRLGNPFISSWCSFPLAASLVSKTPSANDTVRWIGGITYSKNLLRIYTGCSSSCWIQIQYPYCCQHWNKRKVLLSKKTGKRNRNKSCATTEYL